MKNIRNLFFCVIFQSVCFFRIVICKHFVFNFGLLSQTRVRKGRVLQISRSYSCTMLPYPVSLPHSGTSAEEYEENTWGRKGVS